MTAKQSHAITDPQSIIAALQQRLDAALLEKATLADELAAQAAEMATRTAELAERKTEFDERIGHQAATIDVLKAMSASPGDPRHVFDLIVRRAKELCNSKAAGIYEYDGALVHVRSDYGARDIAGAATYFAMSSATCRSRRPADNFCSMWSAASTSGPP